MTEETEIHPSLTRLYEVAGVNTPGELAILLNESPQTITNWSNRGVSKQGAIKASTTFPNCTTAYIISGAKSLSIVVKNSESLDIPVLSAKGSMGDGVNNQDADIVVDHLSLTKDWIHKRFKSVKQLSKLRLIHGIGDSMSPTFTDGDVLLVDTADINTDVDGVFVLEAHNRLFIKRVRQKLNGEYEISSDNPSVKTVDVLNGEHEVSVRGRVIWIWNGKPV